MGATLIKAALANSPGAWPRTLTSTPGERSVKPQVEAQYEVCLASAVAATEWVGSTRGFQTTDPGNAYYPRLGSHARKGTVVGSIPHLNPWAQTLEEVISTAKSLRL